MRSANWIMIIRIGGAVAISLLAMGCATYLLVNGVEVPAAYWGIAGVAVGGVVGGIATAAVAERVNGK